MKTVPVIIFYLILMCTIYSCTKEEYTPESIFSSNRLIALECSVYGVDSIFYDDEMINSISSYKNNNSELTIDETYVLARSGDEIKVSLARSREEVCTLIFEGSKISQIQGVNKGLSVEFYYYGERLDYMLYRRDNALDSIAVFYDRNNENITRIEWYSISSKSATPLFTSDYTFDAKKNPFNNSVYWLVKHWQGPDDIIQYFNTGNILSIGSHKLSYGYNDNEYPVYMDISYYGRTLFHYQPY